MKASVKPVLVVGDVMLDTYAFGKVSRISPEAPVPVVHITRETMTVGGAGNVSNNLQHLGYTPILIGCIGADLHGQQLMKLTKGSSIKFFPIQTDQPTITKMRVIGEHQQVTRLDYEDIQAMSKSEEQKLKSEIERHSPVSFAIISDYGKGLCTESFCQWLIEYMKNKGVKCCVDPKGAQWEKYRGAFIVTPNLKEVESILRRPVSNSDKAVEQAGKEILQQYDIDSLLITRSEKGMTLITPSEVRHFPTVAREVYDVSGAGDTVIATLVWALSQGYELVEAVRLSNIAAGIVVSKLGTTPIELDELLEAINPTDTKCLGREELYETLKRRRKTGQKVVFTNGCFDILHKGHIQYLRKAKDLGDILVVALNSDASVKRLKGSDRPINSADDRCEVLSHYEWIDYLTIFDEDTPLDLIRLLQPDILVKGGDYKPDEVVGREHAGKVVILPYVEGYSTTNVIERMKK